MYFTLDPMRKKREKKNYYFHFSINLPVAVIKSSLHYISTSRFYIACDNYYEKAIHCLPLVCYCDLLSSDWLQFAPFHAYRILLH